MIKFDPENLSAAGTTSRMISKEMTALLGLANLTVISEVVTNKTTAVNGHMRLFVVGETLSKGDIFKRQKAPTQRVSLADAARHRDYVALEAVVGPHVDIYVGRMGGDGIIDGRIHHLHINRAAVGYPKDSL